MTDYHAEILLAAAEFAIPGDLVEAVVVIESSGHADAFRYEPAFYDRYLRGKPEWARWIPRRAASSYGLMQIMFPVARELGFMDEPEMLFVPRINLHYGCKKLARLLGWSRRDVSKALAAYNGGMGNWQGEAPQRYAQKVLRELGRAKEERFA